MSDEFVLKLTEDEFIIVWTMLANKVLFEGPPEVTDDAYSRFAAKVRELVDEKYSDLDDLDLESTTMTIAGTEEPQNEEHNK